MDLLGLSFEHCNWSVGADLEKILAFNPVGRVPILVLDDGQSLIDSSVILDYLDHLVGPERGLLPPSGKSRHEALQLMAIATGAADKGVAQLYEVAFRPERKRHAPWLSRCARQVASALNELERRADACRSSWLSGERLGQADITVTAMCTFLHESLKLDEQIRPALMTRVRQCEALPSFQRYRERFFAPQPLE